jgi:ribosomal protein S18 acetylase RimI-like enzyme
MGEVRAVTPMVRSKCIKRSKSAHGHGSVVSLWFVVCVSLYIHLAHVSALTISSPPVHKTTKQPATIFASAADKIPFIIEEVPTHANNALYFKIANMCIEAFFNDGPSDQFTPPWKSYQLASLRRMQEVDLRVRRRSHTDTNFMLIARQVIPAEPGMAQYTPLLLNLNSVVHANLLKGEDFVRGDVLGFVEVTQRPYGIGGTDSVKDIKSRNAKYNLKRPILTNLSVTYEARKSGVGSKLLERSEEEVVRRWNMPEMILEVEDDNANALAFYEKRGYKVLFEDPTCRKFNLEGLWLQQVRCTRLIFRKDLSPFALAVEASNVKEAQNFGSRVMQRIRERVFSTV